MSVALRNGCYNSTYSRVAKSWKMSILPRDWRLLQRNYNFEKKILSQLETFHLNAFLYVLKKYLCEERNEREIPLALYIRLEYSTEKWQLYIIKTLANLWPLYVFNQWLILHMSWNQPLLDPLLGLFNTLHICSRHLKMCIEKVDAGFMTNRLGFELSNLSNEYLNFTLTT